MKTINIIILGFVILLTALILIIPVRNFFKKNETITVTGLAQKDFTSDLVVWTSSIARKAQNIQEGYTALQRDMDVVKKYLLTKGIKEDEIVFSSVNFGKDYKYVTNKEGGSEQIFDGYSLSQTITVKSNEVEKIELIARQVTELLNSGIELNSYAPQYYYTKLSELKLEMLAGATRDGKDRAAKIAENAGGKLGELKYASQGTFQITAQNSDENYSWGGTFNTESKEKTVTVTVRLQFSIKNSIF